MIMIIRELTIFTTYSNQQLYLTRYELAQKTKDYSLKTRVANTDLATILVIFSVKTSHHEIYHASQFVNKTKMIVIIN